jgi:poly(A) polymerase
MDEVALGSIIDDLAPLSRRFVDAGHRLYLVGGVVRDLVHGDPLGDGDIDLTTDAVPATTRELVAPLASALWTQGERFGTIGAHVGGRAIEVTTHRAETYAAHSRKPEVVFGTDLTVDLSRRDFTINAMALELPSGSLIDPFGGRADLEERRLRTPIDPQVSFSDDPLRMLRAARFVARFALDPEPQLVSVATASAGRLGIVSVERIHDELERLLAVADPTPGVRLLISTGLLQQVLPSVVAAGRHADCRFGGRTRLEVAMAAATQVRSVAGRRAVVLWPVAEVDGADGVDRVTRHLRYSTADQRSARRVTVAACEVLSSPGPAAALVRRLAIELGADAEVLWEVVPALRAQLSDPELAGRVDDLVRTREALAERGELGRLEPPIDGRAVMAHLGCPPGPEVGRALDELRRVIVADGPIDGARALAHLERWLGGGG